MTEKSNPLLHHSQYHFARIDSVSNMINHLAMMKEEISLYAHAMPGILRGIPCHDVVSVSVDLMNEIDKLKIKFDRIQRKRPFCQSQQLADSSDKAIANEKDQVEGSDPDDVKRINVSPEKDLLDETLNSVNKMMQGFEKHQTSPQEGLTEKHD